MPKKRKKTCGRDHSAKKARMPCLTSFLVWWLILADSDDLMLSRIAELVG